MDVTYSVTWEERIVGQVRIVSRGLYSDIECRCKLPEGEIYRLWVYTDAEKTNLGVLYPGSEEFSLRRRLPTRDIPTLNPIFRIQRPAREADMRFVPVREDTPFAYLSLLPQSRYAVRDGVAGLLIPNQN